MSLYVGEVVINVTDLDRGLAFWTAALGYKVEKKDVDWVTLADPEQKRVQVALQLTDKPKQDLNRLHLDLYSDGTQQQEIERLIGLGAKRIEWNYPPGADFVVMTDPDGNEFCVIA
jgi:catechol 2,3-dioxygenase-like lactoylglutathione lyase family enzyme